MIETKWRVWGLGTGKDEIDSLTNQGWVVVEVTPSDGVFLVKLTRIAELDKKA